MMQFSLSHLDAPGRHAKQLRMRAETLLKTASDLLDEQGSVPVEQQDRAYDLSTEALGLLAQLRGQQAQT